MKHNIIRAFGYFTAFAMLVCFIFSWTVMAAFEASASAPSITLERENIGMGEEIVVRYSGTGMRDWIGIYPDGVRPGPIPSLRWCYAENGSGTVSLIAQSEVDANKSLSPGKYQIYLLQDDGYTILDKKDLTIVFDPQQYLPSISIGSGRTIQINAAKYSPNISYELYLGTASGILPGYTSLGTATLKNNKYTYTVGTCTVIPQAATHIYAYLKAGKEQTSYFASCKIPDSSFYNRASMGNRLYEFQIFTDIHITESNNHIHNVHFGQALRDVLRNSPNSKAIITIGDNTDQGRDLQWRNFNTIKNSVLTAGKPKMYFTMGNHDRDMNGSYEAQVALFKKYTGMPGVYYSFQIENNTFIVLGSESKGGMADLKSAQLNWLKAQLKAAKPGEPVFVFLHEPLKDTVSGSLSYLNPVIQSWYGVKQDKELRTILDGYPNVMFFTGHTHWHFNTTQPMLYGGGKKANYFNSASVGYLWNDENEEVTGSQGYYVEVYQNGIFVRGRDFANGLWTPATQYFVPLSGKSSSTPTPVPPTTPTKSPATPTLRPTQTQQGTLGTSTPQTATPSATLQNTVGTHSGQATPTIAPSNTATPSASHSASVSTASPSPFSPSPATDTKSSAALIVVAAILSAAAIGAAVAAGVILYKYKKG